MKNLKKLLALVVCVAMLIPTVAFAATASPATTELTKANTTISVTAPTYNGKAQAAKVTKVTAKINGKTITLKEGVDYTVNVSKATKAGARVYYRVTGMGKYSGTILKATKVAAQTRFSAKAAAKTYTGKAQTTKVTVTYGGKVLKRGTDYKITGTVRATKAGKYAVKVTGINNFKGTKTIYYTINKAAQKSVKVVANNKTKTIKVTGVKGEAKVTYTTSNPTKVSVKNGKVTVKKGVKKGTKVKVTVKVAATKNYKAYTKSVYYVVK